MMSDYLAWRLARDRMAELERHAGPRAFAPPVPAGRGAAFAAVRRALVVRDLGRLALVALLVALLGTGVVSLLAAAMERHEAGAPAARP